jgi:hypothetical protein
MFKKILIALVAIVVVFAVVVALQPSEFRVVRSATISAPAPAVFAQVNDFHNWEAWSPWAKLDQAAKYSFEGPSAGTGAAFRWAGNEEFTFKPEGDQTAVTWSMAGQNDFIAKAVCLSMNMDETVGGDFEKGLAQMKSAVEAAPKP